VETTTNSTISRAEEYAKVFLTLDILCRLFDLQLVLGGTTLLPWNTAVLLFYGTSTVELTVLPWYRNTTNTGVLPYGTCQQIVVSSKIFVRKKTVYWQRE